MWKDRLAYGLTLTLYTSATNMKPHGSWGEDKTQILGGPPPNNSDYTGSQG